MFNKLFLLILLLTTIAVTAPAQDSPQWRGVNRDGQIAGLPVVKSWPDQLKAKWKIEVGTGHASPLIIGRRIYLHSRQAENEVVSAIDLDTGKILWQDSYLVAYNMNPAARGHGKGPKSTPLFSQGRLYTLGITGILSCYDTIKGKLAWRKNFGDRFNAKAPFFGTAMSPAIDRGLLIVHAGGHDQGGLVALDPATGHEKWAWTGDGPGYASPIFLDIAGKRQIVTQSQQHLIGIWADNGGLLWKIPYETEYVQNIVTPIAYQDLLIFSGINKGVTAIRVGWRDNQWVTDQVWHNKEVSMYMNSPVISGNLLFGLSHRNKGQFFCLDAQTGRTLWTGDPRQGENAAILMANGLLFSLTNEADLLIHTVASKGAVQVKKYRVAESPTWAHPVLVGNRIVVKDENSLQVWSIE